MDLFEIDRSAPAGRPPPLDYRRAATADLVEVALVRGSSVALPTHFHDEDQVTFVVAGRRRFWIDERLFEIAPGQGFLIKAGTPHSSCDEPDGVLCFNAYVRAGGRSLDELIAQLARRWRQSASLPIEAFGGMVQAFPSPPAGAEALIARALDTSTSLAEIAQAARMSREGFSRAFRRAHAMPPSVYRSMSMLNHARRLLRTGVAPAAVAADAGFVDQSHLGRCFRRAFGVTPGRYRSAWHRSHPYQTAPFAAE